MDVPRRLSDALLALILNVGYEGPTEVEKLTGDASNRVYYRLTAGSRKFIVMLLPEKGPASKAEEITKTNRPITELPFVDIQRYFEYRRVLVPTIYGYDEARGVLLMEDFGDLLLYDVVQKAPEKEIRELYELALEQLERLCLIPDTIIPSRSIIFARSFDKDLYNWEFMHFIECAFDQRLKHPPTGATREKIVNGLSKLTDEYLTWGNIIAHRDYHSKNLMVIQPQFGGMKLGVIDFQDALLAPLFYDLASLLRDSYVTIESKLQNQLVESFRERMKERNYNHTDSKEAFRRAFDLMGMHRNLKAAGRFFYIDRVKGNPNYLQYIPRTLGYVAKTLEDYPDLKELKNLMLPHFEELKAACKK